MSRARRPAKADQTTHSEVSGASTSRYVLAAIEFAEAAVLDRRREHNCKYIRLAARRFLKDLTRCQAKDPPFLFSAKWAHKHCEFIEHLPHVEGKWDTKTLTLVPAQVFFVVQLFGFRNFEGGRRFTEALFAVARKNAKSTLAAAIFLSCMCLENEEGAQLVSAATTGPQARIVWKVAQAMVQKTHDLQEEYDLEAFANTIVRAESGAMFKPINAKASTQDGLNPSHTELDEVHAHKTHDLLNVLRSAAGARSNPMFLYTTTEGYENPGPWAELRNFAIQILERILEADHFLVVYFALDDDDDDFDERAWPKANPLYHFSPIMRRQMRQLSSNAKAMPGALAEFQIKRLNRRAAGATTWVNLPKWRRCSGAVDLDSMVGLPCFGAFDLASTTDLTAWRLLWHRPDDDQWFTWGRFWVPEEAVAQRTERKTAPYAGWIAAGYITQTPGDVVDYDRIQVEIEADHARFGCVKIGFDPWNAIQLATNLAANGLPLVQFVQGPRSYHPGFSACEIAYTSGRLHHGGDPVLTWNAANLVPRRDVNLNLAPDRKRSADKIDGMTALLMDFGLAQGDDSGAFADYLANPVSA